MIINAATHNARARANNFFSPARHKNQSLLIKFCSIKWNALHRENASEWHGSACVRCLRHNCLWTLAGVAAIKRELKPDFLLPHRVHNHYTILWHSDTTYTYTHSKMQTIIWMPLGILGNLSCICPEWHNDLHAMRRRMIDVGSMLRFNIGRSFVELSANRKRWQQPKTRAGTMKMSNGVRALCVPCVHSICVYISFNQTICFGLTSFQCDCDRKKYTVNI